MRYANSNHTAAPCINFQPKKWKDMISTSCSCSCNREMAAEAIPIDGAGPCIIESFD